MTWIKFCGCTTWDDVQLARTSGADAVGFIFAPSPRRIAPSHFRRIAKHFPAALEAVAVFVDPEPGDVEQIVDALPQIRLQFAGSEPPDLIARYAERAIKVVHVGDGEPPLEATLAQYPGAGVLFDTKSATQAGGTGTPFAWELARPFVKARKAIVAGGLTPENVGACVRALRPWGVDVRSGIERDGRKDEHLMRAFVRAVREADAD